MKVAKAVLHRLGYTDVAVAKDGADALEKVKADPAGLDAFDIVLMDLHMPVMGGIECTKRLARALPGEQSSHHRGDSGRHSRESPGMFHLWFHLLPHETVQD